MLAREEASDILINIFTFLDLMSNFNIICSMYQVLIHYSFVPHNYLWKFLNTLKYGPIEVASQLVNAGYECMYFFLDICNQ
jgi:hypothetical protein